MKTVRAALAGLLSLFVASVALAQVPSTMPYHTLWGRIGAAPGDSGPAQAIPFASLRQALTISGVATAAHIPMFVDSTGLQQDSGILQAPTLNGIQFFGIGNNVADAISRWPGTKMPQVVVDRLVNWTLINDNTFADMTTLSPPDGTLNQYASYSARLYSTSTFNFNHWAGFEDIPIYSGSGVITNQFSFLSNPVYNSGTVTNRYGLNVQEVIGAGTVTNDYGVYVAALTKGGTTNWGIYTDGTMPSFFGGNLTIGVVGPATTTLRTVTLNGGGSGTGAGGSYGVATGGSGSAFGNSSAIHGTAFDATTEIYSSLVQYRFSGLNNGFLQAGSTGLLASVGSTGTGNVVQSISPVFTGNPSINAVGPATGTVSVFTINGGASGTGAGGAFSVNTGAVGIAFGNSSGIHGTAFDATAEIYSSTGQYRFSGLTGGTLVASSTGLLSAAPAPTVTVLTSGSGATYTTPAGSTRLYIRMAGGGGGGQGGGSPGASNGGTGGTTSFSGGTLSSTGGVGGASGVGGAGGTSANCNVKNSTGNTGGTEFQLGTNYNGGFGGAHPFWGGAGASGLGVAINPTAGITNSGGGGAGGGSTVASSAGGGGGAGAGCEHILTGALSGTYTYTIGAAGSAGGAGTSGVAGGAGGSGYIVVEAYGN